jgi:hypothetical protein
LKQLDSAKFVANHWTLMQGICIPFTFVQCFKNAEMPDCPASSQSGTGMTKVPMPEPVRCRNKVTQPGTGMLRYWTEILDAEMPMPSYGI